MKSKRIKWLEKVARVGEMRNGYNILVGKPDEKKLLGIPRHRWEDNIGMDVRKMRWRIVDWIHLAQNRSSGGLL
jgi:hypothetical protein